jgi:hypothetical protein
VGIGPFATLGCEPRQVRKEATVAADAGAEVWLVSTAMRFIAKCKYNTLNLKIHLLFSKLFI